MYSPFVFWKNFTDFCNAEPTRAEDIFAYATRLEKLSRALVIRDAAEAGTPDVRLIAEYALRLKMMVSATYYPEYKSFINKMKNRKPSQWLAITTTTILDDWKQIHDANTSMPAPGGRANSAVAREGPTGYGGLQRGGGPGNGNGGAGAGNGGNR